ncbi:hypothetical protein E2C01_094428 [Portunus trituberculatus]|uniref:Uncharacterized protein n=1 Tax=Portunus trituberculatus TaxID=210409 RepID=A0A5B7K382_PORTR|nr:hypothetical protein [Portunus trituberculatus]
MHGRGSRANAKLGEEAVECEGASDVRRRKAVLTRMQKQARELFVRQGEVTYTQLECKRKPPHHP